MKVNNMDKFDIELITKQPTPRQLTNQSFMIDYKMLVKTGKHFREAVLRLLNEKIDFSIYPEKETLTIKCYRNGKLKIDYSSLKNRKAKAQIKRVLEDSYPIVY